MKRLCFQSICRLSRSLSLSLPSHREHVRALNKLQAAGFNSQIKTQTTAQNAEIFIQLREDIVCFLPISPV